MQLEARLRAYAAVARRGSISRAAEELFLSQPAVSKHVAALEREVGVELVIRAPGGSALTAAGRVLADYVLRAEALLANASRAVAAAANAGVVAVAASGVPGTYLLPDLVARFANDRPAVDVRLELTTSAGALEAVRSHAVELAVVGGLEVPRELEAEALLVDEVVLVGAPPLGRRRLRAGELSGMTWIGREEGSSTRAAVEAMRWQIGLRPQRTIELPSWEAVKLAVAAGEGIAAVSRFAVVRELESRTLVVLDVPRWRLTRTIAAVTAQGVPLTPPASAFLELLRDELPTRALRAAPRSSVRATSRSSSSRARRGRR